MNEDKRTKPPRKRKKTLADMLRTAFKKVFDVVLVRRFLILVERPIDPLDENASKHHTIHTFAVIKVESDSELESYMLPDNPKTAALFLKRIQNPVLSYYPVLIDKALAAYVWVAHSNYFDPALGITIPVAPHEAYFFDGYVYPAMREGFAALNLINMVRDEVFKFGKTKALALSDITSRRSLLYHYSDKFTDTMRCVKITKLFGKVVSAHFDVYEEPYLCRKRLIGKKK